MAITTVAFLAVFGEPLRLLARDWITDSEAAHALLLVPVAAWLLYRSGRRADARPRPWLGGAILVAAIVLRLVAGVAAELFLMRLSIVGGLVALTVFYLGVRQLTAWWLPLLLLVLSIPLPAVVLGSIALPLQLEASRLGAALLEARHIPVMLSGNIIHLPGQDLFVTEACSGLRSLTALLSLAALVGGMSLHGPAARILLLAAALPIAVLVNAVRVFLTGYAVYYIGPDAGVGLLHATEGWAMFLGAFAALVMTGWILRRAETMFRRGREV